MMKNKLLFILGGKNNEYIRNIKNNELRKEHSINS